MVAQIWRNLVSCKPLPPRQTRAYANCHPLHSAEIASDEAYRLFATKLLALAAEMERRPVPAEGAYMFPYRLWLRFGHYAMIAWFLTAIPEEMRGRLPVEVAKQVVHYCTLAIDLYDKGAKDYVTERAKRSKRTPPVVRQSRAVASLYRLLASTYLELHPNDAAYDCATAFRHLSDGAKYLEGIDHPQVRWDAARIWCELGSLIWRTHMRQILRIMHE